MKLWLIQQDDNRDHDTYDSAVVAAATEIDAINTHPDASGNWDADLWASSPKFVQAQYLGEAAEGTPAGVILASFKAG